MVHISSLELFRAYLKRKKTKAEEHTHLASPNAKLYIKGKHGQYPIIVQKNANQRSV